MIKVIYRRILMILCFVFVSLNTYAQPGPPVDPDVPISGIEILLFLGGALGLRKYLSSRKKQDH